MHDANVSAEYVSLVDVESADFSSQWITVSSRLHNQLF